MALGMRLLVPASLLVAVTTAAVASLAGPGKWEQTVVASPAPRDPAHRVHALDPFEPPGPALTKASRLHLRALDRSNPWTASGSPQAQAHPTLLDVRRSLYLIKQAVASDDRVSAAVLYDGL